ILATPAAGYQFVNWTSSGGGTFGDASDPSTTFTMPGANVTVTANFALIPPDTYTLTMAENPAGSGTASDQTGTGPYEEDETVNILATPAAGYQFVNWTSSGGGTFGDASDPSTTFTMPGANVTVTANFELIPDGPLPGPGPTITVAGIMDYTITASSGSGGSISDEGITTLAEGESKTYTITPKDGYQISEVVVDGSSIGAVETYTFSNVSADHTIHVDFGIVGQVGVAGITEQDATIEVLGVMEELPYTGHNWLYSLAGMLLLAIGSFVISWRLKLAKASK
ncbi:MAG: hypothetical protein PHN32_08170, partial [Actinomycetota bacterium]|nr:hypothetical protein [Actinomycetota bacterium]